MSFNFAFEASIETDKYDLVISQNSIEINEDGEEQIEDLDFQEFSSKIQNIDDINKYNRFSNIVILDNLKINILTLTNIIPAFEKEKSEYSQKDIKYVKFKNNVSVKTLNCYNLTTSDDKLHFIPYNDKSKINFDDTEKDKINDVENLHFEFYNNNILNFKHIQNSLIKFISNSNESNFSTINYYENKENALNSEFNNTFTGNLNLYYELYYPQQDQDKKEYTIEGNINIISLKVKNYNSDDEAQIENSQILKNDISNDFEDETPTQILKINISKLTYYNLNCQFGTNQIIEIYDSKTNDHYETYDKTIPNLFDIINDNLNKNKNYLIDSDNLKIKSESISNDNELNYLLSNKVKFFEHELMKGEKLTVSALKLGDEKINDQINYKLKSKSKIENQEKEKAKDITIINGTNQKLTIDNETSSENLYIHPFYDVEETTITELKDDEKKINKSDNDCDNKYVSGSYSRDTPSGTYVRGDSEVQEAIDKLKKKIIDLKYTDLEKYNNCLDYLKKYGIEEEILYKNCSITSSAVSVFSGLVKYYDLTNLISEKNPSHTLIIKSNRDGQGPKVYDSFITEIKGNIKIVNETMNEQTINFKEKENQNNQDEIANQIQINKLTIDSKSNVKLSFSESLTKGDPDIGTVELLGDSTVSFENLEKTTNPITLIIPYGKDISDVVVGDVPPTLKINKENAPQTTDEQLKEMKNNIDELTDKINNLNSKLNKALAVLILTNNNLI